MELLSGCNAVSGSSPKASEAVNLQWPGNLLVSHRSTGPISVPISPAMVIRGTHYRAITCRRCGDSMWAAYTLPPPPGHKCGQAHTRRHKNNQAVIAVAIEMTVFILAIH